MALVLTEQVPVPIEGERRAAERQDAKKARLRRGSRGGRPPAFDGEAYKGRNVAERCANRLKDFRALATRYEKRARAYRATVLIAMIMIWL